MAKNRTTLFEEELRSSKPRNSKLNTNHAYEKFNKTKNKPTKKVGEKSNTFVVKITGGATDSSAASRHFDYISRNNQLDIYDNENQKIDLDDLKNHSEDLILNDKSRSDSKKTYQIILSTQNITDHEKFREVILETAQQEFKDHDFYFAVHDDTDNLHAHIVVFRKSNSNKKRLEIDKKKLNKIKSTYHKNINKKFGLSLSFKSHSEKFEHIDKSNLHVFKKRKRIKNQYTVIDYGTAPYKFKDNQPTGFYLKLKNSNGTESTQWSWGLKDELIKKSIRPGEQIILKKVKNEDPNIKKSLWNIEKIENISQDMDQYKIVNFGAAPYRFNQTSNPSYFLLLENDKGSVKQIWNKDIESFINTNGLKKGDSLLISDTNLIVNTNAVNKIDQSIKQSSSIGIDDPGKKFHTLLNNVRKDQSLKNDPNSVNKIKI